MNKISLQNGLESFLPLTAPLLGSPPLPGASNGAGAVGCLYRPEWLSRRNAADCLKALAVSLGPSLEPEGCWDVHDSRCCTARCIKGLESCKFDKVRALLDYGGLKV
jgi:hypothetical protein